MMYTGNIFGIQSSNGSIYNVQTDDAKCYLWKASVSGEMAAMGLVIKYTWNGYLYELRMREIKTDYYTGEIFSEGEVWGNVYLWKFSNGKEFLLKGDYCEEGVDYNVFIELRPS